MSVFSNTYQTRRFSFWAIQKPKTTDMKTTFYLIITFLFLSTQQVNSQTLNDLEWMSGYWTASDNGMTMEEVWTSPSAGMMLGLHRDTFANGRGSFEYLRIVQINNEIHYVASLGGGPSTSFKLKEVSANKAVFENLEHDFPQRIIYSLEENSLTARIEDESGEKGMQWTWNKTTFNQNE
ncbi:MAG: hypothetical protein ED557_07125 [Balneola sp.]|nr:MAG: hypothetical protein ED557_07125 [Balneola sp.]